MGNNGGTAPVLEAKKIIKKYPGVEALKGINFDLKPGEVRGLLGKNGAGKSTFIKIISLRGKNEWRALLWRKAEIRSVQDSERLGFRFYIARTSIDGRFKYCRKYCIQEKNYRLN